MTDDPKQRSASVLRDAIEKLETMAASIDDLARTEVSGKERQNLLDRSKRIRTGLDRIRQGLRDLDKSNDT